MLPQIDDYEWFYILENYLTTGNADMNIISEVRASIGEATIIQVAPIGDNNDGVVAEESIPLDSFNGSLINGLSPLVIDKKDYALWHFIVINPLQKRDLETLKTTIQNIDYDGRKVTIDDLRNPEILIAIRTDLQTVYSKVFKGGNEYSMCMLSELADRKVYNSYSRYNKRYCRCMDCRRYVCYEQCRNDLYDIDGGMYSGDADFLHCDTLNCLQKRLQGREGYVGMLQLPHHGSKENFNIELLDWLRNVKVAFACYGSPNRYNHPSSDVMGLVGTYSCAIGVNQYKSNVLTERIDVWKNGKVGGVYDIIR